MNLRLQNLSIRAKLAIILGVTIFALAATRAFGLSQLGEFLDRFMGYTTTLETLHQAQSALHAAELAAAQQRPGADPGAAQDAARAVDRLAALAPKAGLEGVDLGILRSALDPASQAQALRALREQLASRFEQQRSVAAGAYAVETKIMNGTYVSMLLIVLIVGIIAYFLIAKMVIRPLARMVGVADAVAAGDLRARIEATGSDELAQVMRALGEMNAGLASLIGEVRNASNAITLGTSQIGIL
jgi:methyl-accepting chemotaxis protein